MHGMWRILAAVMISIAASTDVFGEALINPAPLSAAKSVITSDTIEPGLTAPRATARR